MYNCVDYIVDEIITVDAAGVRLHAQVSGARPGVVFLHGFAGDLHTWDTLWPALGEDLPALRYDLRGYGLSAGEQEPPFSHADDLLALLDALALDRVDLVGVSMGGAIATNFAIDHPRRVRRLVLISPGLVAWEWSGDWQALWQPIVEQARAGHMDAARHLWWRHPLFATTRDSDAAPALFESIMRFAGAQWLGDGQRPALPEVERLHRLGARTLLLTGERDMADFRLIADLIEASVDDVRRVDMPGRGHLLHLEAPAACARHILDFLDGIPGVTGG